MQHDQSGHKHTQSADYIIKLIKHNTENKQVQQNNNFSKSSFVLIH